MGWWIGGLVGWWSGLVDGLDWSAGLDWWIGGVEACSLGLGGLQVKSSTRDRDGSADNNNNMNIIASRIPAARPEGSPFAARGILSF